MALKRWIEQRLGGRVVSIERQPRWRPIWFADVERDGERLALCVRGQRLDGTTPWSHRHEMILLTELGRAGLPVPRVHGWIDDERGFVMDRIPGEPDLVDCSAAERSSVLDDWLRNLVRLHRLDVAPFAAAGITRARAPKEAGRVGLARMEAAYRAGKLGPDPLVEFALGWLRRNPLDNRGREAVVSWDSGQFHHLDGRLTGLLDLEMGHIGDPLMDLAGLPGREIFLGFGDLGAVCRRYEELGGYAVDLDAVEYYAIAFLLTVPLMFHHSLRRPTPLADYAVNFRWCALAGRWICEFLARRLGLELPPPPPEPGDAEVERFRASPHAHLVTALEDLSRGEPDFAQYRRAASHRLALHLQRTDAIGDAVSRADLDELEPLLGERPASWNAGEAALERFVLADRGDRDPELLALLYRRQCRQEQLLGPTGAGAGALWTPQPIPVPGRA